MAAPRQAVGEPANAFRGSLKRLDYVADLTHFSLERRECGGQRVQPCRERLAHLLEVAIERIDRPALLGELPLQWLGRLADAAKLRRYRVAQTLELLVRAFERLSEAIEIIAHRAERPLEAADVLAQRVERRHGLPQMPRRRPDLTPELVGQRTDRPSGMGYPSQIGKRPRHQLRWEEQLIDQWGHDLSVFAARLPALYRPASDF